MKLKAFSKFDSTVDALSSATALVDSKLSKGAHLRPSQAQILHACTLLCPSCNRACKQYCSPGNAPIVTALSTCADLKKFLKKNAAGNTLGVADSKLGSIIKEKLGIPCIFR